MWCISLSTRLGRAPLPRNYEYDRHHLPPPGGILLEQTAPQSPWIERTEVGGTVFAYGSINHIKEAIFRSMVRNQLDFVWKLERIEKRDTESPCWKVYEDQMNLRRTPAPLQRRRLAVMKIREQQQRVRSLPRLQNDEAARLIAEYIAKNGVRVCRLRTRDLSRKPIPIPASPHEVTMTIQNTLLHDALRRQRKTTDDLEAAGIFAVGSPALRMGMSRLRTWTTRHSKRS